LSFPIFSGTERIHQANEAEITLQESQNDLTNLTQQIHLQIKNTDIQYQNNQAQLITQKENMNLTEGVYQRIQYKFEQGVSSSLDLLSAENELQQAQSNYIDALLNTLMSGVDLQQALGKINP
ncbi:MAG: TolC family protein, partial [Chitinophagaceae bacterium]